MTNHTRFNIGYRGYISAYYCPTNWFHIEDFDNIPAYLGQDHMTTNEAIELARATIVKLGYKSELAQSGDMPEIEGPFDICAGMA